MNVLLIMRLCYKKYLDQIQALQQLGFKIHLITEEQSAKNDYHFSTVFLISNNAGYKKLYDVAKALHLQNGLDLVLTFRETEIILAAKISRDLDLPGIELWPAIISRDKQKQRALLEENNIPSPISIPVRSGDVENGFAAMAYPLIVKPTQAALSLGVRLVRDERELQEAVHTIQTFANTNKLHYFEDEAEYIALLEEFLPGEEVTVDGVVLDGKFILGGIHNKRRNPGPYFIEDLYSLPFKYPECESNIQETVSAICRALDLKNGMFNAELRQDQNGQYKVLEFSTRLSGAFCYRHIKKVYDIDLVSLAVKKLVGLEISYDEAQRSHPMLSSCTKWIFGEGLLKRNSPERVFNYSEVEEYFALAGPGDKVYGPPNGIGCLGRLSLYGPYKSIEDVASLERKAIEIAKHVDIDIIPLQCEHDV